MLDDGAKLAALVLQADPIDWVGKTRWVRRAHALDVEAFKLDAESGAVDRRFWALGHIEGSRDDEAEGLLLRVNFEEDKSAEWVARFTGNKLVFSRRLAPEARSAAASAPQSERTPPISHNDNTGAAEGRPPI
jgi:hypothetical protein